MGKVAGVCEYAGEMEFSAKIVCKPATKALPHKNKVLGANHGGKLFKNLFWGSAHVVKLRGNDVLGGHHFAKSLVVLVVCFAKKSVYVQN